MTSIQQFEIDGQKVWVEVADVSLSNPSPGRERFANTSAGSSPASAVAKAVEKADISATLKTVVGSVQQAMAALLDVRAVDDGGRVSEFVDVAGAARVGVGVVGRNDGPVGVGIGNDVVRDGAHVLPFSGCAGL